MSDTKQIILIRKDLKMRRGKEISQACHASMAVLLNLMETIKNKEVQIGEPGNVMMLHLYQFPDLEEWLDNSFTKISLSVNSEEELLDLYNKAKENNLLCSLIQDNGTTEFHGIKTYTAVAIGPAKNEDLDKITGHLKLL